MANVPWIPQNYNSPVDTVNPIAPPPTIQMAQPNQAIPDMQLGASHQAIPNMQLGVSHDQSVRPSSAPPVSGSPASGATRPWSSGDNPQADYLAQAIKIYDSMAPAQVGGSVGYTGVPGTGKLADYDRSVASMGQDAGRASSQSYSAGGGVGGQQRPTTPFEAIKSPDMPKYRGEEYNAPGRDEGAYDAERSKAMGPGLRALRESTSEAISSAQSLDNPNARGKFIEQALHGYGKGLESVASGASREATNITDRRHSENVADYRIKFDYKRDEDLLNYKTEIGKIASDFAAESAANIANYNAGITDGSGAMNTGDARSKSTYYNSQTPNMGYFA